MLQRSRNLKKKAKKKLKLKQPQLIQKSNNKLKELKVNQIMKSNLSVLIFNHKKNKQVDYNVN